MPDEACSHTNRAGLACAHEQRWHVPSRSPLVGPTECLRCANRFGLATSQDAGDAMHDFEAEVKDA